MQQWIMAKTARAMKARTVTVLEPEEVETEKTDDNQTKGIPLFEGLADEVHIEVYRLEPIEEGTIGSLGADADEATIRRRWGGGIYRVVAKGNNGQFQRRQRTVTIAGDPKFESKDALRKYRIKMGELNDEAPTRSTPAPAPAPGMGMAEVLALVTQSHGQQMEMMRLQLEASKQDANERERRARQESTDREDRLRRESDERLARDQQFHANMLQMVKSDAKDSAKHTDGGATLVETLLKGLALGRELGGGGGGAEVDPVTAFVTSLPTILPQAQALLQGSQAAAAPPPPVAVQQPGQPQQRAIRLTGKIAENFEKTVATLEAKGYNPEQTLGHALDQLRTVPNAPTKADPPQAAAAAGGAPPAPPARRPGGNGTSPAPRATRKK